MAGYKPVKATGVLQEKFGRRAFEAGKDYKDGVLSNTNQNAAAKAAGDLWLSGVNTAGVAKFERGLTRAGQDKYIRNASGKGATRYPQGAKDAAPDWGAGMEPILNAFRTGSLSPRGLRRSPQNITRMQENIINIEKAAAARP